METMKFEVTFALGENCREELIEHFMKDGDKTPEDFHHTSTDVLLVEYLKTEINCNADYDQITMQIVEAKTILE